MNPVAIPFCILAALAVSVTAKLPVEIHRPTAIETVGFARQGQFPYHVSIQIAKDLNAIEHICSGAILSNRWIITSAYCSQVTTDVAEYRVQVGDIDFAAGVKYTVERLVTHENFDPEKNLWSVEMWKTHENITFNDRVKAIPVDTKGLVDVSKESMNVTGWGSMFKDTIKPFLKSQVMFEMPEAECEKHYRKADLHQPAHCVTHTAGECEADLGSPFVRNGLLYGVADRALQCDDPNQPQRFSEMHVMAEWIAKVLKE